MVAGVHSAKTTLAQLPRPPPPTIHLGAKANGERKGVLHMHCWGRLGRQSFDANQQPAAAAKPQTYRPVLHGPVPAGKAPKVPLPSCQRSSSRTLGLSQVSVWSLSPGYREPSSRSYSKGSTMNPRVSFSEHLPPSHLLA